MSRVTRKKILIPTVVTLSSALIAGISAYADNLEGSDKFLCAAVETTICTPDGICESGPPYLISVPQFVEVDLKRKSLATTKASNENRTTEIRNVDRTNGFIYVQGLQSDRAFSLVMTEATGFATMAIAMEDISITMFGSCTPLQR